MATAATITTTDQARLALFLLPWREEIGNSVGLPGHVAEEIRRAAGDTYRDGTYESPYRDICGWDRVSVQADDGVQFGGAEIRLTSSANMAPCARDHGVTRWSHQVSGYTDVLRTLTSVWYKAEAKAAAASIGREMLRLAGTPLPPGVAAGRAERAATRSREAWSAVKRADAKLSAARLEESAIMFGRADAPEGVTRAQAREAVKAADDEVWTARQAWREARDRLGSALRERRLDELAAAIASPAPSRI